MAVSIEVQKEFDQLWAEAKRLVELNPSADQVIVVKTEQSNVYHFINNPLSGDYENEDRFVQMLLDQKDSVVKYIVCMWNNYALDIPSFHLRKLLLDANSRNGDTAMVMQGEEKIIVKDLKWSMP